MELEAVRFDAEDVITTSDSANCGDDGGASDCICKEDCFKLSSN